MHGKNKLTMRQREPHFIEESKKVKKKQHHYWNNSIKERTRELDSSQIKCKINISLHVMSVSKESLVCVFIQIPYEPNNNAVEEDHLIISSGEVVKQRYNIIFRL